MHHEPRPFDYLVGFVEVNGILYQQLKLSKLYKQMEVYPLDIEFQQPNSSLTQSL